MNAKSPMADGRLPMEPQPAAAFSASIANRKSQIANRAAFTLIELLVVISIMAVLAGFTLVVLGGIKKRQYLNTASAELNQIATALDNYKNKYGVYPPANANPGGTYAPPADRSILSQLYYELSGTTNNGTYFITLDGASQILVSSPGNDVNKAYDVGGFINCSKGSGEDAQAARNFLPSLKPNRINQFVTNNGVQTTVLVTSVGGPDPAYKPLGASGLNPFRYAYPGTNNPGSYDLWVQLVINGKTNLICNWNKQVLINSPLP